MRVSQSPLLKPGAGYVTVPGMQPPRAPGHPARARRRPPRRARRARRRLVVVLIVLAFLVTLVLAAFGSSPSTSFRSALPASASRLLPAGPPKPEVIAVASTLRLQLPIAQAYVTAIGYHAAGPDALPLDPLGAQKNEGLFSRVFHRLFGGGADGLSWYQLGGGEGASTGAVDVGAAAGTDVYSPVDGTVVGIRKYIVDARPYGSELQIQPQGAPTVVVSLTHVRADPALTVGSPLSAGSSKVGTVVDFSGVERQALAAHTQDAGNHVTIEVEPAATISLR
jgi:hypothetical protein